MSIAVTIEDLPSAIELQIGWCYLLTTTDPDVPEARGQVRVLAVAPHWAVGGVLVAELGGRTAENVQHRPDVTLVYPPATAEGMSLIIDGTATVRDGVMSFTPSTAVMHRPANPSAAPSASPSAAPSASP